MKKIFLLIVLIFLLSSCSGIKIVIEKDCDCKCDEQKSNNIENKKNFENTNKSTENIDFVETIEKPELIRYLTGKFTVNQDDNYTYVYYKNNLLAKFENNISNFSEEELEEKPMIREEKNILKIELARKIVVSNLKQNLYLIELENSGKKVLVDIKNNKSWNINFVKSPFKKVIFGNTGKYLMYSGNKKCNGGLIYINNEKQDLKKVFENDCNYIGEYPENYKEITDFKLGNGVIKVYYIDYLGDKKIEKIYLDEI